MIIYTTGKNIIATTATTADEKHMCAKCPAAASVQNTGILCSSHTSSCSPKKLVVKTPEPQCRNHTKRENLGASPFTPDTLKQEIPALLRRSQPSTSLTDWEMPTSTPPKMRHTPKTRARNPRPGLGFTTSSNSLCIIHCPSTLVRTSERPPNSLCSLKHQASRTNQEPIYSLQVQ